MDKKTIFLVTADSLHDGTATRTVFSGIFVLENDPDIRKLLNETELEVLDLLESEGSEFIRFGCVTGYTDSNFSMKDEELQSMHGLNKRFEF